MSGSRGGIAMNGGDRWRIVVARVRMPLLAAAVVLVFVGAAVGVPVVVRVAVLGAAMALAYRVGKVRRDATVLATPVHGRWQAFNSPADKVPSHGVHNYGQTYAIDLVHVPDDAGRLPFGWWPLARRPAVFPSFGEPLLAPVDGTVVRAGDWQRDHWSRTSWPALAYFFVEGIPRELGGPQFILGNHLVLEDRAGGYVVLVHLRRRSLRVAIGDDVTAGDHVADCGNSGNSTEPHVHVQVMDHPRPFIAAGLPMAFDRFDVDGELRSGLPPAGQPFTVPGER